MADLAEQAAPQQKSDFRKYLDANPDLVNQMMKILSTLYNDPKKVSETPE